MIRIDISRVIGYAIHPNAGPEEVGEILVSFPESRVGVAFIDLALSREVMSLVERLEAAGQQVVGYYDHHFDPRRSQEVRHLRQLAAKYGQKVRAVDRRQAPSSVHLVESGAWKQIKVSVVFFHADFDGFLGFLKGCGVSYPEMEDDADILDGAANGRRLSLAGKLLADAHENLVPPFSQDPVGHHAEKQRVYQTMADWIVSGCQVDEIQLFAEKVRQATEAAEDLARKLAWGEETELIGGNVAFCNMLPYITTGQQIAIPTWKRELLRRFSSVLICSVGTGHMGEQVYIELPKDWQGRIDLRDFLPQGIRGRLPMRVQVPLNLWPDFLVNWQKNF